jgi:hypothetical protein
MQSRSEADTNNIVFFNNLLEEFEVIWANCFVGKSISKSAAFNAFVHVNQTSNLMCFFNELENEEPTDDGDEWKTKR